MNDQRNIKCSSAQPKTINFIYRWYQGRVIILLIIIMGILPVYSFAQGLASGKSKFLGGATSNSIWSGFDLYWNQVTPGNDGKWGSVESIQGSPNWSNLDRIYNYAVQRGIPFKDHVLVWGSQQPSWIDVLDSASQRAAVENWIRNVGERYPNMAMIDVLNEPFHEPKPSYKNALGGDGATGWDWVITAFTWARQYCAPNVKLILNEYNVLHSNTVTTNYLTIINLLKDRNLIDGIGVQGHYFEFRGHLDIPDSYNYDTATIRSNLERLTATGLPVYITEFDIDEADDANQLASYQKYFPIFWNNPGVKGITLWGYIQSDIWASHPTTYLLLTDGTERPALTWLRNFIANGNYRSKQSGDWSQASTWEKYDGTFWNDVLSVPTFADDAVTIRNGHLVTVSTSDTTNKLTVAAGGTLAINTGANLVVKKGPSVAVGLNVSGTVLNNGIIEPDTSTSISIGSAGTYIHGQDGGTIPSAMWVSGSNCQFEYVESTVPFNINQNFSKFTWNCMAQTGNLNLNWNGNTINGNITVQNTGSGQLQMCAPEEGFSDTVAITGDIIQSGGQFTANGSNNGNTTVVINHSGNINITGGDFSISRGSQGGTGTTTWNLTNGNFSMSNATAQNMTTTPNGAKFVFSKVGTQTFTIGSGNSISSLPIQINGGTTLSTGTSVITGSGNFSLASGATLACANTGGLDNLLQTTGTVTLSNQANFTFNGTAAQITGNLLPDSAGILTINNAAGVTLSKSVVINTTLNMQSGALAFAGGPLLYGENGSLAYLGTAARTTSNAEFPSANGPKNLLIPNSSGIILHESRKISGNLNLYSNAKLMLGNSDLTASSVLNTTRLYYVQTQGTGKLRLPSSSAPVIFPIGTKVGYAPVAIKHSVIADTIEASVMDDSTSVTYGGRVLARWNINSNIQEAVNDSIQFGWIYSFIDATLGGSWNTVKIFHMSESDTSEAGSGDYAYQAVSSVFSVSRSGISSLGTFCIGKSATTDVETISPIGMPNEFALSQNYPNPFNPSTVIDYQLPTASHVIMKVYDMLGREVTTLVDAAKNAGYHKVTFNAKNLSSGVYFYRINAGNYSTVKKLVLMK